MWKLSNKTKNSSTVIYAKKLWCVNLILAHIKNTDRRVLFTLTHVDCSETEGYKKLPILTTVDRPTSYSSGFFWRFQSSVSRTFCQFGHTHSEGVWENANNFCASSNTSIWGELWFMYCKILIIKKLRLIKSFLLTMAEKIVFLLEYFSI